MIKLIVPWFAIFLFGCAIFAVGKIFQHSEKLRRKAKMAEVERGLSFKQALAQLGMHEQESGLKGIMEGLRGQGQSAGTGKFN